MMRDPRSSGRKRSSKGGKILPALCGILGTVLLLAVIASVLPLTIPRLRGYEIYNVVSGSMAPSIPVGSAVYVRPLSPEAVREGDVVAFRDGDSVVTHRVVRNNVVTGRFTTKGDANAEPDPNSVPYEALIGRVERHIPMLGAMMELVTSPVGKLYALGIALCGVLFHVLAGRIREREERKRRSVERKLARQLRENDGERQKTP